MINYGDVLTDRNVIREIDRANRVEKNMDYGMDHCLAVVRIVDYVLTKLEFDKEYIEMAKIAALLHDIGKKKGEHGHAKRGAEFSEIYLATKDIKEEYKKEIYDAIKNHSDPKKILTPMHACVALGDKLDLKKSRLLIGGYKDKYAKDIKYIEESKLEITKKKNVYTMYVDYTVTDGFSIDIFNHYKRYILIPRMVAKYFKIECIFRINGKIENFDKKIWLLKEKM